MAEDNKTLDTVIKIGGAIGMFLVGKKLLEIFGILQTKEEQQAAANANTLATNTQSNPSGNPPPATLPNNPAYALSATYWLVIYKYYLSKYPNLTFNKDAQSKLPWSNLWDLSEQVHKSYGLFNDDEESLYSAFRACETQFQVSLMAWYFQYRYNVDMYFYIESFTNTAERSEIYTIIQSYPQVYTYW